MIGIADIRAAVTGVLRRGTDIAWITGEDVDNSKDDMEITQPLLQVSVEPVTYRSQAAGCQISKTVLVDIAYMQGLSATMESIQRTLDTIAALLLPCIAVEDRQLQPDSLSCNITDNVGHCVFYLEYTEALPQQEEPPAGADAQVEIKLF